MLHRTATAAGRALYKLRQQTIESIFGIIQEALEFRRFLLRGLDKVSLEWELVCLAYNFKRLHRLNAPAAPGLTTPTRDKSKEKIAKTNPQPPSKLSRPVPRTVIKSKLRLLRFHKSSGLSAVTEIWGFFTSERLLVKVP